MTEPIERDLDLGWCDRIQRGLVGWYDSGHRELPWRRDRDPYRILVSEIMLVQTTATAAAPHFERFIARFPSVNTLAEASESDIVKAWEGLGYYRRARQLHRAAQVIVREHNGLVPPNLAPLLALPGVGRYIAGAVLSFAFDLPAPIVEANTQRVLARLLAWGDDISKPHSQRRLWQIAERLVPQVHAGRFNQAIMELGATICSPQQPKCLLCPIAAECSARARGLQATLPVKIAKPVPLQAVEATAVITRNQRFLVVRRGNGRLWEGFWEFPTIQVAGADPAGRSFGEPVELDEGIHRLTGIKVATQAADHVVKFSVTKHRVSLNVHRGAYLSGPCIPYSGFSDVQFASIEEIEAMTMASAMRAVAKWAMRSGSISHPS